jgi:GT2 family glycosyltransferase
MPDDSVSCLSFDLGVICVTHNSAALIAQFAAGVRRALEDLNAVVVFVDSGSGDSTVEVVRAEVPNAHVVEMSANRGFSAGINAGIRHVEGLGGADAYAVLNPDVVLGAGCLARLVSAVREPGVGIAAPRLQDEHGVLLPSLRRKPRIVATWCDAIVGGPTAARLRLPTEVIRDPMAYRDDRDAGWATGGMLVVSRACSLAVGEWDESFFMYEEEVDFALRAADAGFVLRFVQDATATRTIGPPANAPWAQALMRTNRISLVTRRSGRAVGLATWLGSLIGELLRAARGRRESGAAAWAILRSLSPDQVMRRYRPDSRAVVGDPPRTSETTRGTRRPGLR